MRSLGAVVVLWVLLLSACGEAPPPPPAAPPPAPVAAPAPDLSPVAEPKTLLALARWKDPLGGVEHALELLKKPLAIRALLEREAPEVYKAIKLDASFDLALSIDPSSKDDDPKVFGAASIPLASFDAARAAIEKRYGNLEELKPGVFRLPLKQNEKARCDVAMSVGDAPARLVCGSDSKDLDALRDYLTRGLPHAPPARDPIEATIRFRALKDRFDAQLRALAPEGDKTARKKLGELGVQDAELLAVPGVLIDEGLKFIDDADRLDFGFQLKDKPPEIISTTSFKFAGRTSWITDVVAESADHRRAPPASFWRLPKDSISASWGQAGDPARYDGIRRIVHKALAFALEKAPMPAADRTAVLALVDGFPRASGPWVSANGVLIGPKADPKKPRSKLAETKNYAQTALGWTIVGVHGPATQYVGWGKEGVDVYERAVRLGKQNLKTPKQQEALPFIPVLSQINSPPGWPKGTTAFDLKVTFDGELSETLAALRSVSIVSAKTPAGKKPAALPKESVTFRVAIVPDGDDTWIAFSGDSAELLKRVKAVMSGAPDTATISTREGLAALRTSDRVSAGFFTFGGTLDKLAEVAEKEALKDRALFSEITSAMPNKGTTPILFFTDATGGKAPSTTLEIRFEEGTLQDLVGAIVKAALKDNPKALDFKF